MFKKWRFWSVVLIVGLLLLSRVVIRAPELAEAPANPGYTVRETPGILFRMSGDSAADSVLIEGLRTGLVVEGIPTQTLLTESEDAVPLVVVTAACAGESCRVTVDVRLPPDAESALPPSLVNTTLSGQYELVLDRDQPEALITALSGLYYLLAQDCPTALPYLSDTAHNDQPVMAFLYAACLYDQHDYAAAIDLLTAARDDDAISGPFALLWDATIAHNMAQNFAFDDALALDDATITAAVALHDATGSALTRDLLAELYLLRGQHRLYLYEWDVVMEDYNAALIVAPDLPHGYYLRGMLNYTENSRQPAYDDLTRYLALETDPHSPFLPLARQAVRELQSLLATPDAR